MKKGNPLALLPIIVFLILFVGVGVTSGDFYSMPAIVGFLIALVIAFLQNPKLDFENKLSIVAKGAGDKNIITMCLIFLLAGAFSSAVKEAGGVESTVNFGLTILPGNMAVVGIFVIGCYISVSMGTSVGTIAALSPIGVGIAEKTGIPLPICIGAVVCGAMFGDNLSMISDTTIAAVRTQGCEMKDKFRQNFFIVLPAAIITIFILYIRTNNIDYNVSERLPYHFIQIVPYLVVLIGALIGFNVFLVLIAGTVISLGVGIGMGKFGFLDSFRVLGDGVTSMYDITVISIIVASIIALIKANGGIDTILSFIKNRINGKKGAQFGIAVLAGLVDCCTANNTVAIVISGPIAKEIAEEFDIEPKTSASLLDIFTSFAQGIIPYGAQLLTAAQLSNLSPFQIIPNLYYPVLMAISAILFIFFRKDPVKDRKLC